jgi:hypothetical protein
MREDIGCTQERLLALQACGVTTEEAKRQDLASAVKRRSKNEFTSHANSSHDTPSTSRDTSTVSKMGPMIVEGPATLWVLRQNPPVRSEPYRATRARDEATQRVAIIWRIQGPIEGTRHAQASYLSLDQEVSFTLLRVGLLVFFTSARTGWSRLHVPVLR